MTKITEKMVHTMYKDDFAYVINSYDKVTYKHLQPLRILTKKWALRYFFKRVHNY